VFALFRLIKMEVSKLFQGHGLVVIHRIMIIVLWLENVEWLWRRSLLRFLVALWSVLMRLGTTALSWVCVLLIFRCKNNQHSLAAVDWQNE